MSQLPWGGKPDSPTDEPAATGPRQDAPAGPEAGNEACDCTCPDYGEKPWLPTPDSPYDGPGGDPDYEGTYYVLKRCQDDADQPAWVQSDEFSTGDVLLIETDGIQACFYVDTVEVANASVQDSNVIRPNDVIQDYANCAACQVVSGSPDPPLPPILPTSYAQMALCSDDTLAALWTPVEVYGQPVAEDLTKIYESAGICYYVSDNIQVSPGGPLFPVMGATVHATCVACLPVVCTDCGPGVGGSAPSNAQATGATNSSRTWCANTFVFDWTNTAIGFSSDASKCKWVYQSAAEAPYGTYWGIVEVVYVKATYNESDICGGGTTSFTAGNWYLRYYIEDATVPDPAGLASWEYEQTTGFTCSGVTGKMSGTHTFASAPCTGTACVGTPTITIDP